MKAVFCIFLRASLISLLIKESWAEAGCSACPPSAPVASGAALSGTQTLGDHKVKILKGVAVKTQPSRICFLKLTLGCGQPANCPGCSRWSRWARHPDQLSQWRTEPHASGFFVCVRILSVLGLQVPIKSYLVPTVPTKSSEGVSGCTPQAYQACACPTSRLKKEPGVNRDR